MDSNMVRHMAAWALLVAAAGAGVCGCAATDQRSPAASAGHVSSSSTPEPVAPWRRALLREGFDVASQIPVDPHAKDRARAQEEVVQVCLELGLIDDAVDCADRMTGWRRCDLYALIGLKYAASGDAARARLMALRALDSPADIEDWARDMVATQAARVYLAIGDESRALEVMQGRATAEVAKFEVARVASADAAQLDSQADAFDRGIATLNFDLARSGIDGYSALLVRVIDDAPRRDRALKALESAIKGLPIDLQVSVNADLAVSLHAHGQPALAAQFLGRAAELNKNTTFLAQDLAPYGVIVAKARLRTGDAAGARADLERLRTQYYAHSEEIVNLRRAQSLRALAEGFALIGDRDAAVRCQRDAIEAGTINPNSRPRAEDLSATCASIARTGIEPDAATRKQIERARAGLADPW